MYCCKMSHISCSQPKIPFRRFLLFVNWCCLRVVYVLASFLILLLRVDPDVWTMKKHVRSVHRMRFEVRFIRVLFVQRVLVNCICAVVQCSTLVQKVPSKARYVLFCSYIGGFVEHFFIETLSYITESQTMLVSDGFCKSSALSQRLAHVV